MESLGMLPASLCCLWWVHQFIGTDAEAWGRVHGVVSTVFPSYPYGQVVDLNCFELLERAAGLRKDLMFWEAGWMVWSVGVCVYAHVCMLQQCVHAHMSACLCKTWYSSLPVGLFFPPMLAHSFARLLVFLHALLQPAMAAEVRDTLIAA